MEKRKLKSLGSVVDSLFHLIDWRNPLRDSFFSKNHLRKMEFELDLISGEMIPFREDILGELYLEKSKWFLDFLKKKNIPLEMIDFAKIEVKDLIEKVMIKTYDGRVFEKEVELGNLERYNSST